MANATVINPADGSENNAAPHTEGTSMNVPMNSAINLRVIVPASSKDPLAMFRGNTPMIASAEVLGSPTARFRSRVQPPRIRPAYTRAARNRPDLALITAADDFLRSHRLHSKRILPQSWPPSQLRPRWRCTAPRGGEGGVNYFAQSYPGSG